MKRIKLIGAFLMVCGVLSAQSSRKAKTRPGWPPERLPSIASP